MWLEVGYGNPLFKIYPSGGSILIGLEALVWSRLGVLSDFRFPVENADYFFGAYVVWNGHDHREVDGDSILSAGEHWRFRISHISSHDVDGKDSITGGSSSRYSREFVELTRRFRVLNRTELFATVGIRTYFHQVTKIEPSIAFPASLSIPISFWDQDGIFAFVSSADGPVWPSIAAGLRVQRGVHLEDTNTGLELFYYYGASWAGTDAGAKVSQLKLQLDVRGL